MLSAAQPFTQTDDDVKYELIDQIEIARLLAATDLMRQA